MTVSSHGEVIVETGSAYASGNWIVSPGREREFVERWKAFLAWTQEAAPGLLSARLIQESTDPRHFISFASWESTEAISHWRSLADFPVRLGTCRALCDDFRGLDYRLAARL